MFSVVIHWRAYIGLTAWMLSRGELMEISPRVVEAITLNSQSASASPFGKLVSMIPTAGSSGSMRSCQVPISGTGSGPCENQMWCQWDAITRPPIEA